MPVTVYKYVESNDEEKARVKAAVADLVNLAKKHKCSILTVITLSIPDEPREHIESRQIEIMPNGELCFNENGIVNKATLEQVCQASKSYRGFTGKMK